MENLSFPNGRLLCHYPKEKIDFELDVQDFYLTIKSPE